MLTHLNVLLGVIYIYGIGIYVYIGRHCICFVGRNAALEISNCLRGQSKWLDRGTQAHIRLMLLDFPVSC